MINKALFKKPNNRLEGEQEAARDAEPTVVCAECKDTLPRAAVAGTDFVCPRCGTPLAMGARERIRWLTDEGSFQETETGHRAVDRLGFPGYAEKLVKAQRDSGEPEGVLTGLAAVDGEPCALFVMEPYFIMGSMGAVVGEKITRLFELATQECLPVIGYTVSGGARIQEGMFSLMQMAKTSGAVLRHSEKGLLYAAVLTHPTTGGVVASFAMEADVILAEPKAQIGFTGPRVIEQTMRQKLPPGFQRSEFMLQKGFIDRIVPRNAQKKELSMLLKLHGRGGRA
ncbi:MAG: acetyl-CoA carboxylase carboxyl transferase subunit beta [Eubacteriales bacterium]|nr:acetyl-CoA carboxylase carboxyl transferase subunit beta [Eubacteriales bacterium]